jgi:gliding motility-associated-like protein
MLQASAAGGSFSWTPAVQIINAGTPNPTVSPLVTTTYVVQLDDNGCLNTDSVKVRVTDHVSVQAMPDTLICSGDTIRLRIVSDGLAYSWMPASQLTDPLLAAPLAITPATTSYVVNAMIGGCSATDQVVVTTVPYPVADAGKDTTICFGTAAFLKGSTNGSSVSWQPAASLSDATRLDPVARPTSTTAYILLSYATNGCPKPGRDTVLVNVNPRVRAFAGNDTSVVVNQPVQLQASGGIAYQWFPPLYLSATNIANPIAVFSSESFVIRYKVLVYDAFCVDSAFVSVRIFRTLPTVFVPTAFTPNRDGLNDIIKPIAAGMQQLEEFNIYNRWGQLVFSTRRNGIGWDGKLNGVDQGTGTYIWTVKALDYQGKPYFQKGTTTLIR